MLRQFLKKIVLLEAGAAIFFFGALAQMGEIQKCGFDALRGLERLGYSIPTANDPVRVYPAGTQGDLTSAHAGGWHPGVITLREAPLGGFGPCIYLRHELMHEAAFRTCGGKLPLWAEESLAMSFSGEVAPSTTSSPDPPTPAELDHVKHRIAMGATLDAESYRTLSQLTTEYGRDDGAANALRPCTVSESLEKVLHPTPPPKIPSFSAILVHLASGHVLESSGDQDSRYSPGSLLKIPYVASLNTASPQEAAASALGRELAASDTDRLLLRKTSLDFERYRFLTSMAIQPGTSLFQETSSLGLEKRCERFWRSTMGERDTDGGFPLQANLPELAGMLRISLQSTPERFAGLWQNGLMEDSTLHGQPEADKGVLRKLRALSKTGTVSDERGNPLVGHLMVAWPAEHPCFLAVFRNLGTTGAATLRQAGRVLNDWATRHQPESATVRVRILSLLPHNSWEILDESPTLELINGKGWKKRLSTRGRFRIPSSARGSRSERIVAGILYTSPDARQVVLETDSQWYAEAVTDAEAQALPSEARKAMRAVIVWNAVHGGSRHPHTQSVCDTTHCMVFLGDPPEKEPRLGPPADPVLMGQLDGLGSKKKLDWLFFSKGGAEKWKKTLSASEMKEVLREQTVLDIRRERARNGDVFIHLLYGDTEETVPCEVFRNTVKLPSCPEAIHRDESKDGWLFSGVGAGHGQGVSVERARALAQSGGTAGDILADAYE